MKVAMTTLIVIAAMSTSSYAQFYNAAAALGACQEDALQGVHYPINGDCPNWEAWKASHTQAQTLPRRHAYPASRRRRRGPDAVEDMRGQSAVISSDQSNSFASIPQRIISRSTRYWPERPHLSQVIRSTASLPTMSRNVIAPSGASQPPLNPQRALHLRRCRGELLSVSGPVTVDNCRKKR